MEHTAPPRPKLSSDQRAALEQARRELHAHAEELIRFWAERALDREHGGYLTCFGEDGRSLGTREKYLNTQCRLLWWFSWLQQRRPDDARWSHLARQGFDFIQKHFWDARHGGWFWKVRADGAPSDNGKVVYGQSFAIYALAQHAIAFGDTGALARADETFALLQRHCADVRFAGYLENLEPDWSPSAAGFAAGDRKSLDTHMHLMESFTVLYAASNESVHRRRLLEITDLIRAHMIDAEAGCGRNQFDLAWRPIPAIAIRRTWNAERVGEAPAVPTDTTSYGHNVELSWLMRRAHEVAGEGMVAALPAMRGLLEHALAHGVDWEDGGVFRDGTARGEALVREKEFWQNSESLVGFLDGFEAFGDERCLAAFLNVWDFARRHFIARCGEWRVLLNRHGAPLNSDVGNDWKVSYHTGRAVLECCARLDRMLQGA